MKKTFGFKFAILLILVNLSFNLFASYNAGNKPYILLILVDDLKPNLGTYGDPFLRIPSKYCA